MKNVEVSKVFKLVVWLWVYKTSVGSSNPFRAASCGSIYNKILQVFFHKSISFLRKYKNFFYSLGSKVTQVALTSTTFQCFISLLSSHLHKQQPGQFFLSYVFFIYLLSFLTPEFSYVTYFIFRFWRIWLWGVVFW